MQRQLRELDVSSGPLTDPSAGSVANVRFRPEDVTFYEPMPIIHGDHKILKINRYQPLDWDDDFPPVLSDIARSHPPGEHEDDDSPERSEAERTRASQKATTYDPRHTRLQNGLYRSLLAHYGKSAVQYEVGFVDLTLTKDGRVAFVEVKTDLTVKSCIRSALGQLLEYAHYPDHRKSFEYLYNETRKKYPQITAAGRRPRD